MVNINKVNDILAYFAKEVPSLTITKVMKLFYYVDFISFAEKDSSVTNDTYYRLPYGPIPSFIKNEINLITNDDKDLEQSQLSSGFTVKKEKIGEYNAYVIKNNQKDDNVEFKNLSKYESELVKRVVDKFKSFSAKELVDKTHSEKPYLLTSENSIISYELAKFLEINSI